LTHEIFDREDFKTDGDQIKRHAFDAVMCAWDSQITDEAFHELLFEAFTVFGFVVRAQVLESIDKYREQDTLTADRVDQTINFLAKRMDGAAYRLGHMVELIEETKTPGPRH
jgi:hypothetical protein